MKDAQEVHFGHYFIILFTELLSFGVPYFCSFVCLLLDQRLGFKKSTQCTE